MTARNIRDILFILKTRFPSNRPISDIIFRKMIDEIRPKGWMKQLGKYMGELGISLSHLKTMSDEEVGGAVNRSQGDRWRVRSCCSCIEIRRALGMRRYTAIDLEQSSCSNVGRIL